MKAYKGFNSDMTCRGFQFEEGKSYEEERAEVCKSGFHACENPLDCFSFYAPATSEYHEVELDGDIEKSDVGDTKVAATKIRIGAKLSIAGLVQAAIDHVYNNAATLGNYAHAEVKGADSVAAVLGKGCRARGGMGCWLVLTERDDDWHVIGVQAVKVDGEDVLPDTWYQLRGGKIVMAAE